MINTVTVVNPQGLVLTVDLHRPEDSGFLITNITGIGPPKATVNFSDKSTTDGAFFNSSRVSTRNIVFDLVFVSDSDIEAVRQLSYRYFPVKKNVLLIFETDHRTVMTEGYVESNTPNIFSKMESTQISILCPDPYFYSLQDQENPFSFITPAFSFPFSNESLTTSMLSMGLITLRQTMVVTYNGEVDTGVTALIHANGAVTNPVITHQPSGISMRVDTTKLAALTGSGIVSGDDIRITTLRGAKSARLIRNGVATNIMRCLGLNSSWFTLQNGDNIFSYTADLGVGNMQVSVWNSQVYEGV